MSVTWEEYRKLLAEHNALRQVAGLLVEQVQNMGNAGDSSARHNALSAVYHYAQLVRDALPPEPVPDYIKPPANPRTISPLEAYARMASVFILPSM